MSWATCDRGHAHWGPRGAAGLLIAHEGSVLLQLRARWAHQGGTWSIPGGARERGESAVEAAVRESYEELGVEPGSVDIRDSWVADCGGWTYETVLAVSASLPELRDRSESDGHRWVRVDDVLALPLHSAFRAAWEHPDAVLRSFVEGSA
ncbi:NUDIX domain-containing protein [Nocardioides sp. R-C-SC26]|uniref:NUDIX domain-containing protein n=1 Tax=Nocardioides sp. R-C-SC26 TaxID=2870414 RepID=UPI001E5523A0|nr:NUDIX hydrolase [Nocardioides sp. R-C-SC26]